MVNITDKTQCTGCTACKEVCVHNAISMQFDAYGHSYPKVNTDTCVNCGLCEKVCPLLHREKLPKDDDLSTLSVHAVFNKDNEVRKQSTSGGVFTVLSDYIIKNGGVVFAARFDESYHIFHSSFDKMEDINPYRGSKYAQSDLKDTFREIKKELKSRKVLFIGTPCQVAGLKSYLIKDYDNLYTCDFICMGISSPVIWEDYLKTYWSGHAIDKIFFKDKRYGWHNWKMLIQYDGNKEYLVNGSNDPFFYGYLTHLTYRPSCLECSFRTCKRVSDFTIADCWGIDKVHAEFDDNKGCTTLILQSDKAKDTFEQLKGNLNIGEYSIEDVKQYNPYIVTKIQSHSHRKEFYQLYREKGFKAAASKYKAQDISLISRIKNKIRNLIKQ